MHPVRQFLDVVSSGGRPTKADIQDVIEASLRGELDDTSQQERVLGSMLRRATKEILAHVERGESGTARQTASWFADELAKTLPENPPRRSDHKTAREIVDSIPRTG